jgi:ketosteroid isomerase-like protein
MAEQVPAVGNILTLIERRDWARFEALLHPDVHWSTAAEDELHGPAAVVDRLRRDPPPAPPAYHELRDGLLVRWIDVPG